jgi:hypothetical protein
MFTTVCSLAAGNKMIYVTKQHWKGLQQNFSDHIEDCGRFPLCPWSM